MTYEQENDAKANFEDVYTAPTPHAYVAAMARHGYEIGEQARPYCAAAVRLLSRANGPAWPVQMLDVGCSYGLGAAFVRHGCSFDELVAFFATRAPREYAAACEATRMWLHVTAPVCDLRCVGLDRSAPAIRFAVDAGLLDFGLAHDLEGGAARLDDEDRSWLRTCNLLISTGAIGYVTERTLAVVLAELGKDYPGEFGPAAVITILRMFDPAPIAAAFARAGFACARVREVRLPQRRFADDEERARVLALLRRRELDTTGWEDRGKHYADLYVAALPERLPDLEAAMTRTHARPLRAAAAYIRR